MGSVPPPMQGGLRLFPITPSPPPFISPRSSGSHEGNEQGIIAQALEMWLSIWKQEVRSGPLEAHSCHQRMGVGAGLLPPPISLQCRKL